MEAYRFTSREPGSGRFVSSSTCLGYSGGNLVTILFLGFMAGVLPLVDGGAKGYVV